MTEITLFSRLRQSMTVYIEYAFLQNFLLDGVLLWLAGRASRTPVKWGWLLFSAAFGGVFAVLFPLLRLSKAGAFLLKLAVGMLLPLLAIGKGNRWGMYAMNMIFFLLLSFCFGGMLLMGMENFALQTLSWGWVAVGFAFLTAILLLLLEKCYQKRAIYRHIYDCRVFYGEKSVKTKGFYDSGNLATKGGLPICFLSADILFDLCGEVLLFGNQEGICGGQVFDEQRISTQAGERIVRLYKGKIAIKTGRSEIEKEVYFARAANRISREYKIILHSRIFEECEVGRDL